MKEASRWPTTSVTLRSALLGVAAVAMLLGAEATRRRWSYFRQKANHHRSMEQFCKDAAGTYRTPEFWDPYTADSAAREAARHGRLRRHYETGW
jgi:hypothetical protein